MEIPDNLKITLEAARINVKMTQNKVAKILGVSRATIINWEKGKSSPNVIQADKLYKIYNRPKDSIIF